MKLKVTLNSKQRSISLERKLTPTSREKTNVEFKFREILGIKIQQRLVFIDVAKKPQVLIKNCSAHTCTSNVDPEQSTQSGWVRQQNAENHSKKPHFRMEVTLNQRVNPIKLLESLQLIPCLALAIATGIRQNYPAFSQDDDENPHEYYPVLKDNTLVQAVQLVYQELQKDERCKSVEHIVKHYTAIESAFSALLISRKSVTPSEE